MRVLHIAQLPVAKRQIESSVLLNQLWNGKRPAPSGLPAVPWNKRLGHAARPALTSLAYVLAAVSWSDQVITGGCQTTHAKKLV